MSRPIYDPTVPRDISARQQGTRRLLRRPSPVASPEPVHWVRMSVDDFDISGSLNNVFVNPMWFSGPSAQDVTIDASDGYDEFMHVRTYNSSYGLPSVSYSAYTVELDSPGIYSAMFIGQLTGFPDPPTGRIKSAHIDWPLWTDPDAMIGGVRDHDRDPMVIVDERVWAASTMRITQQDIDESGNFAFPTFGFNYTGTGTFTFDGTFFFWRNGMWDGETTMDVPDDPWT